jgi:hypothetical protein
MNKRSMLFGLMLFPLLCALAVLAPAQAANHTSPSRQHVADSASRNQLAAYLADFQNHPDDPTLRKEIVELAATMNPAPAISPLARDSFARATARMKTASSADDFKAAARLFEQASVQAPWYADADYSAAAARAKAADYDGAKRDLAFYQAAVRPGVDPNLAEELRSDIDSQVAARQFQQALGQFAANPSSGARLQIIKLAQAMKTPPEIPEDARGHYVMASVLANSIEDNPTYAKRSVDEYNAALLSAPWWGDVYKKLAGVQTTLGQYDDAITNLSYYLLIQPSDARNTQDEIYRLKALGQKAVDDEAARQAQEQQRKLRLQQQQQKLADAAVSNFSIEGRWYQVSTPSSYFVGDEANPECDYVIKRAGERWTISNSCARHAWTIEDVEVQARNVSFRILGHDAAFPFGEVTVTFTLSSDGRALEGQANPYDRTFNTIRSRPARWMRRD